MRFHVLPNDLDFNMHMNNGRYLTLMDLGRFDCLARCGVLKYAFKRKYAPVLGGVQIRYRLPLKPFQAYDLETEIKCWDEKWAYLEQRFVIANGKKAGAVAAIAVVKGSFYDANLKKTIPSRDIIALSREPDIQSPPMPEYFKAWVKAEQALKSVTANDK